MTTKKLVIKKDTGLINEDWYRSLLEDCAAIGVEFGFNARNLVIQSKWELGKRISQDNDDMNRQKVYGKQIVSSLATDLGISSTHVWQCIQFYKQFEVETYTKVEAKAPWGKDISWYKITQQYLGVRTKDKVPNHSYKLDKILQTFKDYARKHLSLDTDKAIDKSVSVCREMIIGNK